MDQRTRKNENNRFERIIGAMTAKGLVEYLEPGVLILTPVTGKILSSPSLPPRSRQHRAIAGRS